MTFDTEIQDRIAKDARDHEERMEEIRHQHGLAMERIARGELTAENIGDFNEAEEALAREATTPQQPTPDPREMLQAVSRAPVTNTEKWTAAHKTPTDKGMFDDLGDWAQQRDTIVKRADTGIMGE